MEWQADSTGTDMGSCGNSLYFGCDTCADGTLTATALSGTGPYTYQWSMLPAGTAGFRIEGASLYFDDLRSVTGGNGTALIPLSATATLNGTAPGTWYAVTATDQLGCTGGKALSLEAPGSMAGTPGWKLNGNSGLDANGVQQWLGTSDSTDMVLKTNGQEVLKLRADGVTELMGGLRIGVMANILEPCGPDNPSARLMMDGNGFVRAVMPCPPPPECSTPSIEPWSLPPDGNVENIALCNAYQNVGIGMVNPTHRLHVVGTGYFSGNVGIGIQSPSEKLQVNGTVRTNKLLVNTTTGSARLTVKASSTANALEVQDSDGNAAFQVFSDGRVRIRNTPWTTTPGEDRAELELGDFNSVIAGILNGGLSFSTWNAQDAMVIKPWGNVGIGMTSPGYRLDVCGTIRSKEWIVELTGCDFVFEEDHKLMPFEERMQTIKAEKKLPYMDSAIDMQENGASMGESFLGLLQNTEELYLYLSQINERLSAMESENRRLRKEMKAMKN